MSAGELLRSNDLRFLAVAATLTPDEWSAPSLCAAWSNHDVLAHLVIGYRTGLGVVATEMGRHRGSFDHANTALARTLAAARSPADLLDDFARLVDRPRGMGRYFPRRMLLGDHVTHELDILLALDREPTIPADALAAVLNTQVSLPNPFVPAYFNGRGIRLTATDTDWAHGTWTGGTWPRRRSGFRAGRPTEGAATAERGRGGGAVVAGVQSPDPYGLVMISR